MIDIDLSVIVAVDRNGLIGTDGGIPWREPQDMRYFQQVTDGHIVIMGRGTWDSIPEKFRPLPNRLNIIVTRQEDYVAHPNLEVRRVRDNKNPQGPKRPNAVYVNVRNSLRHALSCAHDKLQAREQVFVIGGAQLYRVALPVANRVYLTRVDIEVDVSGAKEVAYFPEMGENAWDLVSTTTVEGKTSKLTFEVYDRIYRGP